MERFGRYFARLLRLLLGLCALVLVLLALYVSLGRQLAPLLGEYRDDLVAQVHERLGIPVEIGELEGSWQGFGPIITVHDIQLGEGKDALRLEHVRLTPDLLASLLARQPRIDSLELQGLQLSFREGEDGRWSVEGLPQRPGGSDPRQLIDLLLTPRRLTLLDSQLTLLPHDGPSLSLTYLGLTLHSGVFGQRLDGRMTLPDGQPVAWRVDAHVDRGDWQRSSADFYLSLPQSDWAKWLPPSLNRQWRIHQLKAGGEFWAHVEKGEASAAVARLNAPQIQASFDGREPVKVADLGVGLYFQREGDDLHMRVSDLAGNLGGQRWGEVEMDLALQRKGEEHWQLRADRLDLGPLLPVVESLAPMPDKAVEWLHGLQPKGVLHNLNFDYWPQRQGAERLGYAFNLEKVGVAAFHEVPAVANVDGTFSGNLGGGQLDANAQDFTLHLATLFPEPWRFRTANARLFWSWDDQAFTLGSHLMKVESDYGRLGGDMLIRLMHDHEQESYMDLRVGMSEGDGRYTPLFLPTVLPEMSKDLAHWLTTAIKGGRVEQGYFQWQGSLKKGAAPEDHAMSLYFKVHDGELDYQPGWPALSQAEGEVFVEDSGVRIRAQSGRILQSQVRDVAVDIPHVPAGEVSRLYVDGDVDSSLGDGLKILQESPIGVQQTFAGWEGEGALKGHLKLDIPLAKAQATKSQVVVDFSTDKARLKIAKPVLELSQLKGDFRYDTASGLSGQKISAQALGTRIAASIRAEGAPGAPRSRILANGQVPLKNLQDWGGVKQTLPLSGRIPFKLDLLIAGQDSLLQVDSDLKGLAIDLPAPLGKPVDEARQSQWRMTLDGPERRYWATYGSTASLAYAAAPEQPLAGRGMLLLGGDPAVLPNTPGLQVRGKLDSLDADAWIAFAKQYANTQAQGAAGLVSGANLQIGSFHGFGGSMDNLGVTLARGDGAWNLGLKSSVLDGQVQIPQGGSRPIQIRLQRLDLPKNPTSDLAAAPTVAQDPLDKVDPRSLPAMDVAIAQLSQGGKAIGAWNFNVRPTPSGTTFNNVDLDMRGLKVRGTLRWEGLPGSTRSSFKGGLDGKNLADVLKAWDFAPTATSERFRLDIDGGWPGSPAYISLRRFGGRMDADMRKGQFVDVEGGANALRVFGLLNFNAINRRLRLDFSDLFGKGLSYDQVKGVLSATDGVYLTREPIKLSGPSSNIEMNGTLDMAHDQIDAKLLVTLPLTNNLPLAALIVGAPAVGGALFVVDKLLGDKVSRFASVEYSVMGPWQNPNISFRKPLKKP
ncbi:YhdP family protein [Pseudomonas knackmussii]|uniref:YhdP family protein n=1 Tax=Pseudomonas knackmussii TaxID=65741 RepID=UPI003BC5A3E2